MINKFRRWLCGAFGHRWALDYSNDLLVCSRCKASIFASWGAAPQRIYWSDTGGEPTNWPTPGKAD